MHKNTVLIDKGLLKDEIAKSGKMYSEITEELGFGRGILNNAATKGKISQLNLKILSDALGKDPEYFVLKEESAPIYMNEKDKDKELRLLRAENKDLKERIINAAKSLGYYVASEKKDS